MMSRPITCECESCLPEQRRQDNTERMWASAVVAVCVKCGGVEDTTVGHLINVRQAFRCSKHRGGGRRK